MLLVEGTTSRHVKQTERVRPNPKPQRAFVLNVWEPSGATMVRQMAVCCAYQPLLLEVIFKELFQAIFAQSEKQNF